MASTNALLTISVPTYNRPENAKNTLLRLIPQLTDEVCVNVLDNCSDIDVGDYFQQYANSEFSGRINFIRHAVNIGADVNFQRCFELCQTPYIWLLGDDDRIETNAVEIILNEINKYKNYDLIGINFCSSVIETDRKEPILIKNTSDLAYKMDAIGNFETISTTIYRTQEYINFIHYASWGAYMMASQIIPAIMAISVNKVLILSEKYIVDIERPENPLERWSEYQFALSISSILEAPIGLKKEEYKALGKKLSLHFDFIWPLSILYTILKSVGYKVELIDNYHIYIYKQLMFKTFEFRTNKIHQLYQFYICLFFLKYKNMLKLLIRIRPGIKNRAERSVPYKLFIR
ncbi:MAG TPA: glycosyltransferase family 2 protein [Sphingobacteriaceae bacterium]|nr:glycosyltransferase family 2 protein [Sphingobacteriaceae bacterium]